MTALPPVEPPRSARPRPGAGECATASPVAHHAEGFDPIPSSRPAPSRSDARERIDPPRRGGGNPGPGTIAPPVAVADLHAGTADPHAAGLGGQPGAGRPAHGIRRRAPGNRRPAPSQLRWATRRRSTDTGQPPTSTRDWPAGSRESSTRTRELAPATREPLTRTREWLAGTGRWPTSTRGSLTRTRRWPTRTGQSSTRERGMTDGYPAATDPYGSVIDLYPATVPGYPAMIGGFLGMADPYPAAVDPYPAMIDPYGSVIDPWFFGLGWAILISFGDSRAFVIAREPSWAGHIGGGSTSPSLSDGCLRVGRTLRVSRFRCSSSNTRPPCAAHRGRFGLPKRPASAPLPPTQTPNTNPAGACRSV